MKRFLKEHKRNLGTRFRLARIHHTIRHRHGPKQVPANERDVIVVAVVRDAAEHVDSFIDHHLKLGVQHIVLIDNGSVDQTVERARQHEHVTVFLSRLDYKYYHKYLRRYALDRFGQRCWILQADIDERFDYPYADTLPLRGFTGYLLKREYTAVVCPMLDLFPDGPIVHWPSRDRLVSESVWYDHSALQRFPYCLPTGEEILSRYNGGVRRKIFGISPNLIKHPLLLGAGGALPSLVSSHQAYNIRPADINGVLRHYKFDSRFHETCRLAVQRGNYFQGSREYKAYLQQLEADPELSLRQDTARRLEHVDQLVDEGFLHVSEAYRNHVAEHTDRAAPL